MVLEHALLQDRTKWARILEVIESVGQHGDGRAGLGLIPRCDRRNAQHLGFDGWGMDRQGGELGLSCVANYLEAKVHPLDSLRLLCPFGRIRVQAAKVRAHQTSTLRFQAHQGPIQSARWNRGIEVVQLLQESAIGHRVRREEWSVQLVNQGEQVPQESIVMPANEGSRRRAVIHPARGVLDPLIGLLQAFGAVQPVA